MHIKLFNVIIFVLIESVHVIKINKNGISETSKKKKSFMIAYRCDVID